MKKFIFVLMLIILSVHDINAITVDKISGFSLTKNSIQTVDMVESLKPHVVMFLSKDCPCSKANLDYLNQLSHEFKDFVFLGIHSKKNTTQEEANSYFQDKKLNFEIINDSDLKIADQFKALKTPHVFIVNTKGEIVYNGGVTNITNPANAKEHFLKTALTELQAHKEISRPETRTLGCFITR